MKGIPKIKLYGSSGCHKTQHYKLLLDEARLPYQFLDVAANKDHAEELRGLYLNHKLNFPTITIGKKKLRNPAKVDLMKWINKLIPSRLPLIHDIHSRQFIMDINGENAHVEYTLEDGQMFLVHSEVPFNLRGQGIGKVLVEKSFEQLTKEGFQAVAVCSFIKAIAKRSEKYIQCRVTS